MQCHRVVPKRQEERDGHWPPWRPPVLGWKAVGDGEGEASESALGLEEAGQGWGAAQDVRVLSEEGGVAVWAPGPL